VRAWQKVAWCLGRCGVSFGCGKRGPGGGERGPGAEWRSKLSEAWIDAGRGSWDAGIDQEDGSALAGWWAGFNRWSSFSRSGAGFFRLGLFREILCEKFVDLGGNWSEKLMIPGEIRGIGARKFVAM
jgi:hypothetical protein